MSAFSSPPGADSHWGGGYRGYPAQAAGQGSPHAVAGLWTQSFPEGSLSTC